ncbi:6588_t:CDS:2 [Paraglomus occultum]|uniref:6588_t:CDS:1 n=1 Tax=Paraglomus occultum TaxID=144539 RepID=A0A9N9D2E7_9GLOM|nr:6588_t:CDS:2 [Paraglomus occultum]
MATVFEMKVGEPRPKTSWVWPYFDVKTLPDGEPLACCKSCGKTFKHGGSTSNLINHLAKTHKLFPPKMKRASGDDAAKNRKGSINEQASGFGAGSFEQNIETVTGGQPSVGQELVGHPLGFLIGKWQGRGKGTYPGMQEFEYIEDIEIYPDEAGRGWLYYRQKTWNPARNNANFHSEMGYFRCPGVATVEEGQIEGTSLSLHCSNIARSASAKPPHVQEYKRRWQYDPRANTLTYEFFMATSQTPMEPHLFATLHKV